MERMPAFMPSTWKVGWIAGVLWLTCGLCYGAGDADKPTEVIRDEMVGVALYTDGVTPVSDLPVRVWSVDKQRMLYRSKTNTEGVFRIPVLRAGLCYLFVGTVRMNLSILAASESEWHQSNDIVVILTRRMLVGATPSVKPFWFVPALPFLASPKIPKPPVVSP